MKNEQGIVDRAGDCGGGSGVYLTDNVWCWTEITGMAWSLRITTERSNLVTASSLISHPHHYTILHTGSILDVQ